MNETSIKTHSGLCLDFANPEVSSIALMDIAIGLGRECRYANQSRLWYSVAEHSYLMAKQIRTPNKQKYALLHDGHEAYMRDMPKPLKNMIPEYTKIQNSLQAVIYEAFGLLGEEPEELKTCENILFLQEQEYITKFPNEKGFVLHDDFFYNWSPEIATQKWLELFHTI